MEGDCGVLSARCALAEPTASATAPCARTECADAHWLRVHGHFLKAEVPSGNRAPSFLSLLKSTVSAGVFCLRSR